MTVYVLNNGQAVMSGVSPHIIKNEGQFTGNFWELMINFAALSFVCRIHTNVIIRSLNKTEI